MILNLKFKDHADEATIHWALTEIQKLDPNVVESSREGRRVTYTSPNDGHDEVLTAVKTWFDSDPSPIVGYHSVVYPVPDLSSSSSALPDLKHRSQ